MKLNFRNSEMFKHKFNRMPKMWTIEQLHALYLSSKERNEKRRNLISKKQSEIISTIEKNSNDKHVVYYYHDKDKDNSIHKFEFSYMREYKSYGVSRDRLKFSDNPVQKRTEKIEFMISNDQAFKLGQEYYELSKLDTWQHHKVFKIMTDMVEDKLRIHFKDEMPPDIFTIKIGETKYFVELDKSTRYYGSKKFNLIDYSDKFLEIV